MRTPVIALLLTFVVALLLASTAWADGPPRPNILWITSEDNGPHLGAFGDDFADTPNLDGLAARGMIYTNAWSTAPVCAPARTTIISGVYPPSTGSQHMRSSAPMPAFMKMYPQYLREAGYYCTNNSKEDYNLAKPDGVWDVSSRRGHWRNRKPGQPFFAIFNFGASHESRIRANAYTPVHDPAKVRVPAYHPDTPEVRNNWAQYYDRITQMDGQCGKVLAELEADGLADDTIVFFYGDHGSGMPRSKRYPYNSGLNVPLIVSVPERLKHLAPRGYTTGGKSDRLVGFIDLAPTVLSIAGIDPPDYMQGHAFLGKYETPEQPYGFGFRGRMDERYDMVRTARDKRYIYIRNYNPHEIYGQFVAYMFQTQTTRVWKRLYDEGKLEPPKTYFWETKPAEELYDLETDPDEVNNLAGSPEHQDILKRLRKAQQDLAVKIRDVGFLPEGEIHSRAAGSTPYEMGHDDAKYPMRKIMAMAELASSLEPNVTDQLVEGFGDDDSAVRYWAAMGILMRGADAVTTTKTVLDKALADSSPYVRIVAAEALSRYGNRRNADRAVDVLIELADAERNHNFVSMAALNAIDLLGDRAANKIDAIRALPTAPTAATPRTDGYIKRLIDKILADLTDSRSSAIGGGDDDATARDLAKLQGQWKAESWTICGDNENKERLRHSYRIEGTSLILVTDGKDTGATEFTINPVSTPHEINITYKSGRMKGKTIPGIYKFKDGAFINCFAPPGQDRPKVFKSTAENQYFLSVDRPVERDASGPKH